MAKKLAVEVGFGKMTKQDQDDLMKYGHLCEHFSSDIADAIFEATGKRVNADLTVEEENY